MYKKLIVPSRIGINLEGKAGNNVFKKNGTSEHACVPILSEKVESNPKLLRRDKGGNFTQIKKTIDQEHNSIVNMYAPNFGIPNCIKARLCLLVMS